MPKRKTLSKTLRMEVFKRDKFTCQYCGNKAPEVVLHADHIIPVADGGENDIMNLVTSCVDCNLGKGARQLADDSILVRQRDQIEYLAERREQLEMLRSWRDELKELDGARAEFLCAEIRDLASIERDLTEDEKFKVGTWLKRFTVEEILDAAETSAAQYISLADGMVYGFDKYFGYIPAIAHNKKDKSGKQEFWKQVVYIRGILKKRVYLSTIEFDRAKGVIANAVEKLGYDAVKEITVSASDYDDWLEDIQERITE
jgi:hypothetical protein